MVGTVDAVWAELNHNGFIRRYSTEGVSVDGLPGDEGTFLVCSFWMADALRMTGRTKEARELFERLLALRNDVGLLAEEYDAAARRHLGNFRRRSATSGWWGRPSRWRGRRRQDRPMDLGLKDRVYVVTGASRGLGHASARALVADGAKVVVSSRDEKAVARAAEELGAGAVGVAADNADPAAADRLIGAARTHFGRFDGVLISVGGPAPGWAADNTDEQWQAAFDSVFLGAVRMARAAAAALPEGGVIGFVLSGSVYEPIPA